MNINMNIYKYNYIYIYTISIYICDFTCAYMNINIYIYMYMFCFVLTPVVHPSRHSPSLHSKLHELGKCCRPESCKGHMGERMPTID